MQSRFNLIFGFVAATLISLNTVPAFAEETVKATGEKTVTQKILPDDKIDEIINSFIERFKELKHFTADFKQVNTGGMWKRPDVSEGKIYALLPDKLFIDLSANERKIIFDGKYFWLHDLGLDDVERWPVGGDDTGNTPDQKMDVAAFFLGADVKTAEEFRKEFAITGIDLGLANRFVLLPLNKKVAEKTSTIILDLPKGGLMPSYVKTIGTSSGERKPLTTEQWLTNLKTNVDGSAAPDEKIFIFTPTEDMSIRDMRDNSELSYEEVVKDLAKSREK